MSRQKYPQLTPRQNSLMGRRVTAISKITYPMKTVRKGSKGVICDFGKYSGDPLIQWKSFRGFALWNTLLIEGE